MTREDVKSKEGRKQVRTKAASSAAKTTARAQPVKVSASAIAKGAPINLSRLSEHLGLSPTTVSLVLNDSPAGRSIPQRTRDRVSEAAERLGYRPNYFARSLRKSSSMTVGVISPDLSEGYFTQVMGGVEEQLLKANYFYLTASHHWDSKLIDSYPMLLQERAVDGLLLLNTPCSVASDRPVVTISSDRHGPAHTNISLDHDLAAELALRHLYELGHRQIVCMHGPAMIKDSQFRWHGIEGAMQKLGLTLDPALCIKLEVSNSSPEAGYLAVQKLLATGNHFTAVFCFNDISAIGAMSAIRDHGWSVPEDVSVVGFDDIISASFQTPKLTTVRQPLHEMGVEGARILLEQIRTPTEQFPAEILVQPELIVRQSTAAAKSVGNQRKTGKR